ncbi:hypothetical protein PsorP6_002788 [Peronosclerospora sorghi]|uniref:Uncharacterized protein n=1 Tax=Peronosclerospora sorghi TaxID=230839 RepID=A0ACC0VNB6_9STRA|nr:hypothetical protein PsorP6_002788 [Peronosclerospora sorghi]
MEVISPSAVRRLLELLCLQKFNAFYASDRYQRELVDEDGKPIDSLLQVHFSEKIQPKLASVSDGGSGAFADIQLLSRELMTFRDAYLKKDRGGANIECLFCGKKLEKSLWRWYVGRRSDPPT